MKKIVYIVPIIAALILSGCSSSMKSGQNSGGMKTVKLGVIVPLSGDAQAYGEQIQKVIDYQLIKVNEKHKKDNIKFEVMYEDGKCSGTDAVSAFQKLTEIDGIKFILGGACSSETLALAPLTQKGNVFVTSMFSSNPKIEKASDYLYTFSYSDELTAQKVAERMSQYNKVAIISEQNDYNIGLEQAWAKALEKHPNVKIVANEKFAKGSIDFRNVLEKVKKTQPDAIFLNPNVGTTTQNLTKQLAEIKDWTGYDLFGVYPYMTASVLSLAPDLLEGMIIVDAPKTAKPELATIKSEIESSKGTLEDLGLYGVAATMDDLDVVTDLIAEFGENPAAVRSAFVSRDFSGYASDNFNFKNSNFPNVEASAYVVKNNKPEFVK